MKYLIVALLAINFIACSKNEGEQFSSFLNCEDINENYKFYDNETIECQFHFMLTEYNNEQFIELKAHCADLARPIVFNEMCEDICETTPYDENSECGKYLQSRVELEILLIEK